MKIDLTTECYFCHCDPYTCAKDSIGNEFRKFVAATLIITDRCNDECRHCYQRAGFKVPRPDMTTADVDALFNMLDRDCADYSVILSFLGGEPTLNLPVVDYAMTEMMKRRGKNFGRLYTNGADYVDDVVLLLMKHRNMRTQVSLPHHSAKLYKQRLGNVKHYTKLQENKGIEFSLVVEQDDLNSLYDTLRFWKSIGVRELHLNFDLRPATVEDEKSYETKLKAFYEDAYLSLVDEHFALLNFNTMAGKKKGQPVSKSELIVLDYLSDRKFYPTHVREVEPIGDTEHGIDRAKIQAINDAFPCRACEHNEICGAGGYLPNFINHDLSQTKYEGFCLPNRVTCQVARELSQGGRP